MTATVEQVLDEMARTLDKIQQRSALLKTKKISKTIKQTLTANNLNAQKSIQGRIVFLRKNGIHVQVQNYKLINCKPGDDCAPVVHNKTTLRQAISGNVNYKVARVEMFAFMGNQCVRCGENSPGMLMTGDHIYPQAKYPLLVNQIVNLQPLCLECNEAKKDLNTIDYRTPEMKLAAIQRLLVRRGDDVLPSDISARDIDIITARILLHKYRDISIAMHCSESTVSRVVNSNIPALNKLIKELNKLV